MNTVFYRITVCENIRMAFSCAVAVRLRHMRGLSARQGA